MSAQLRTLMNEVDAEQARKHVGDDLRLYCAKHGLARFLSGDQPMRCRIRSNAYLADTRRLQDALSNVDLSRNHALQIAILNRDTDAMGRLLLIAMDHEIADAAQQDVLDEEDGL